VGRILREELAPGERISDSVLAQELGVSRMPAEEGGRRALLPRTLFR
jgi:DNA-binding GntR family transcriptional regulator